MTHLIVKLKSVNGAHDSLINVTLGCDPPGHARTRNRGDPRIYEAPLKDDTITCEACRAVATSTILRGDWPPWGRHAFLDMP